MSSTVTNGKKANSGSNSATITPSSTPVTSVSNMTNGQTSTQTSPPPNNAPKYGYGSRGTTLDSSGGRLNKQYFQKQQDNRKYKDGNKKTAASSSNAKEAGDNNKSERSMTFKRSDYSQSRGAANLKPQQTDFGKKFAEYVNQTAPIMGGPWQQPPSVPRYTAQVGPNVPRSWAYDTPKFLMPPPHHLNNPCYMPIPQSNYPHPQAAHHHPFAMHYHRPYNGEYSQQQTAQNPQTTAAAASAANQQQQQGTADFAPKPPQDIETRSDYSQWESSSKQSTGSIDNNNNKTKTETCTLVPNRIFVGGISASTTEAELLALFSNYGQVKAAKIIQDRAGVSKGYGFITFESEDDARRLQRESDNIVLRERKLNIAPAIKKQPFSRAFDAASPPAVAPGNPQYFFQPSAVPFYHQSGVTYYPPQPAAPGDPTAQQPAVYQPPSVYQPQSGPPQSATYQPVMFPAQPIYVPPQYTIPVPYEYGYYPNNGPQYMVGGQGGSQPQIPTMPRPGSPPRPTCYSQQLPYNTDTVYYNVPIYNAMEAPPVYQDSLEITNGSLAEMHSTQHFMPPSRRNKRNVRRNTAPLSEIGAGDAPLPSADVSDTVKKLDSLKL